jgi:protein-disulfide isomerase
MSRLQFGTVLSALVLCAACKTATTEKSPAPSQTASASSAKSPAALDPSTPVATMDGQTITYADLEKEAKDLPQKIKQKETAFANEVYELRSEAINEVIAKRLFDAEAKKAGKATEAWLKEELDKGVQKPSEADMRKLFDESKERLPPGSEFDAFKDQIAEFLTRKQKQEAYGKKLEALRAQHQIKVALSPARADVEPTGPARGPAAAKVTIVEFSDFQCPFCGREIPVVERIMKEYDGKVRLVFRHFPLDFHAQAAKAAEASLCAADQGKFWELHDKMFQNQEGLQVDKLKEYAKGIGGIDAARFDQCLDSGAKKPQVDADQKAGSEAGVNGTPAFFVNGILISGAQEFDKFKDVIDRELQR